MAVEKFYDPLSAYVAACALEGDTERFLVLAVGGDWQYLYPACASKSMEVLAVVGRIWPTGFCGFVRHKQVRSTWWEENGIQDREWKRACACMVCGRTLQDHP